MTLTTIRKKLLDMTLSSFSVTRKTVPYVGRDFRESVLASVKQNVCPLLHLTIQTADRAVFETLLNHLDLNCGGI